MRVGQIPADYFDGQHNIGRGVSPSSDGVSLSELLELMVPRRVPSNVETAAFVAAANDTWEDYDIITALNAVLTTPIRSGEAVELFGTLELVNAEAAVNNVKYGHGGMPDDDSTVRTFAMTGAIGSDFINDVTLITDGDGNIKIETDDITNVTFVFHLEAFRYTSYTAST